MASSICLSIPSVSLRGRLGDRGNLEPDGLLLPYKSGYRNNG